MNTFKGKMTIYNGFGGTITEVKAVHTTKNGTTNELSVTTLADATAATAVNITAFSDQEDNWTLSFKDSSGDKLTVGFNDAGFEEEDNEGTVIYNISPNAVKLCFPQSGDEKQKF